MGIVMPRAKEVESDVLTTVLVQEDGREAIFSRLSPDAFYVTAHKVLFTILADLHQRQEPLDVSVIMTVLSADQKKHLTAKLIGEILDVPPCVNLDHSIRMLLEMACRRKAIELGSAVCKAGIDLGRQVADIAEARQKRDQAPSLALLSAHEPSFRDKKSFSTFSCPICR